MATTARQPKPPRKGMPEPTARRPSAWTGARASPTFSPALPNARLPGGPQPAASGGFPPVAQANGGPRTQDRVLQQLSGLTGTTITLCTKTGQRYEGVIVSTGSEGDTAGVTLKDVKDISNPGQPLKDQFFMATTNIDTWSSGPAGSQAPNGDSFKTDVDIGLKTAPRRERELQAWADDIPENTTASGRGGPSGHPDELTFGPGASGGSNGWDQFAANEKLFGVKAGFDEEAYTTKIDRNAPDFKEKEKKAQQLVAEIMASTTNNSHIAEERVMNFTGDNNTNEEEKYGAVVRGANAYIPPGARKATVPPSSSPTSTTPAPITKAEIPKVSVNGPEAPAMKDTPKPSSPAPGSAATAMSSADALPAFRSFVSTEKDRLIKKKQALIKSEMDKRMAELVKFSQSFKLNKPIPEDLVGILAKDEEKQRQIREKSNRDAESAQARTIGPPTLTASANLNTSASNTRISAVPATAKLPNAASPQPTGSKAPSLTKTSSSSAAAGKEGTASKRITMYIQPIPPFKGKRASATPPAATSSAATAAATASRSSSTNNASATPLSPTSANRLNVNASSFRPATKATTMPQASGNSSSSSPKGKPTEASPTPQGPPNPFFGTRVLKKGPIIHIKDDFNPFKYHKVVDAAQVVAVWPYSGKRYMQMFPPLPTQPQQQSPHMPPPVPQQMPPPPAYEETSDPAAQAARGFIYYPPYPYPAQPMMPGMPPPGPYAMPPYMPPMPYPMPPNAMYPGTPMGQMPPQPYMPPPGAYPTPPNGGPRPSMPPTPIPSHAHPYYTQSPQMPHAVPYPMMMPPPGAPGVPHPYDGAPAPPVNMGGVGHA